jgi:hypothetical protein
MSTWEKSKPEFYKRYILREPMFETKEQRFGKWFATEIEKQVSEYPIVEMLRPMLGNYSVHEAKLESTIDTPIGPVDVVSYFDAYDPGIGEYKTGKTPWTQKRVNEHGQLDFYNFILGKPVETTLYWLQTQNNESGGIQFTGQVQQFKREVTERDIMNIRERIIKAVVEISEYYNTIIDNTFN